MQQANTQSHLQPLKPSNHLHLRTSLKFSVYQKNNGAVCIAWFPISLQLFFFFANFSREYLYTQPCFPHSVPHLAPPDPVSVRVLAEKQNQQDTEKHRQVQIQIQIYRYRGRVYITYIRRCINILYNIFCILFYSRIYKMYTRYTHIKGEK